MAWTTPKTNWGPDDAIGTTDLNRIEENTKVLRDGLQTVGTTVVSANNLNIGAGCVFHVTGNTSIQRINTTNRAAGDRIVLITDSSAGFNKNIAASGNYYGLKFAGMDFATVANDVLEFVFDGSWWYFVNSRNT